jgi:MFS family permease
MGVPIARWADRGNRITIIATTSALWSVMILFCAAAGNFLQLLTARIGVAVGEAGCIPTANSLIATHFTRAQRAKATAFFLLGGPLSALIGYLLAGWLNELYGWRLTFLFLASPGVFLAVLARATLRDPRSNGSPSASTEDGRQAQLIWNSVNARSGIGDVFRILSRNPTYRNLVYGFACMSFFSYGLSKWQPAFFIRSHGLGTAELGAWLTFVFGVGGLIGTYLGGELTSRLYAGREEFQLELIALVYAAFGVLSLLVYQSNDHRIAFGLMFIVAVGGGLALAPLFAILQSLVPERMRATSIALIYLLANLVGMGLGPLAVGIISDGLNPSFGSDSLRYALSLFCPGYFIGAWFFFRASATVHFDMKQADEHAGSAL